MKKAIISVVLTALMTFLVMAPSASYASGLDTVRVAASPAGNLNNFVNADIGAGGFGKPNTVYLLQQTSDVDTVYYVTAPISRKGSVTIVGRINPKTGHPPVIAPSIAANNSSIGQFFEPQGNDTVSLKGLYFIGTRTDGSSVTGRFASPKGDNNVFIADRCVIENISGDGTPNVFDTWSRDHSSFYITNCIFRNTHDDAIGSPGFAWVDPTPFPCDTAKFYNNTFFVFGGNVLGSSGFGCKVVDFQHNTVFGTNASVMNLPQMTNVTIKNNIFFNVFCAAIPFSWWGGSPGTWGTGVFPINALNSAMLADPYNFKEEDRRITITNNAYFWSNEITENWTVIDALAISGVSPLRPPDYISAQPGMGTDNALYPYVTFADNDSIDPGFDATLAGTVATALAELVETSWVDGSAQGRRAYYRPLSNPPSWEGVPADWAAKQGYPVPENLRYSKTLVGDDGKALGDLNWFPEQVTFSPERAVSGPAGFGLNQNYPNPFNPRTMISYRLSKKGMARLSVYDVLGREIEVLVNQVQNAGTYTVTFTADELGSGLYFYRLEVEDRVFTKKMSLLK